MVSYLPGAKEVSTAADDEGSNGGSGGALGARERAPGLRGFRQAFASFGYTVYRWVAAWYRRRPVEKSIGAFLFASIFLTAYWLVDRTSQIFVAVAFFLTFALGASILYFHTRSRKLLRSTGIAMAAGVLFPVLERVSSVSGSFTVVLVAEGVRAALVPIIAWGFLDAYHQSSAMLDKLRVHVPVVTQGLIFGLFVGGSVAAFAELYFLTVWGSTPEVVQFVARYGIAYLIWTLASLALMFTQAYLLYLAYLTSAGRLTTRRIAIAMVTGVLLFGFVLLNLANILAAPLVGVGPMKIGVHANSVEPALAGPWDNFVHLEVNWINVETAPGVFNWSYFDAQMDLAEQQGTEVFLLLSPVAPQWFVDANLDAAMMDQNRQLFAWVDEDPRVEAVRVWDFSFAAEKVLTAKENFTRAAAFRYADRPSVVAISIQNEPTWPSDFNFFRMASYDNYTQAAFRIWLETKYGTLADLNAALGLSVGNWSEVAAPGGAQSPLWSDWIVFREDLLISLVNRLTAAVREVTAKPVTLKIMAHFLARYTAVQVGLSDRVFRAFIDAIDIVGIDLYPLNRADMQRTLEYFRSLAQGKPIWITEWNFFLSSGLPITGSGFYLALVEMSHYAERAIVFTWEGHYLYGLRLYWYIPGLVGLEMFREARDGGAPITSFPRVLAVDIGAIPNIYGLYVTTSLFANLPVIPWPILLLLLIPIPVADMVRRKKIKRALAFTAIALLMLTIALTNIAKLGLPT